jgi:phytanoyl-CoA hydroxylase
MPHSETDQASGTTFKGVDPYVNDGLLAPTDVVQLRASQPTEPIKELYERYVTDGYLFLKGLIPRADVLAARESYFTSLAPTGVIQPGTAPVDGIFNPAAAPEDYPGIGAGSLDAPDPGSRTTRERFVDAAVKAHVEPWYCGSDKDNITGFCYHEAIRNFVARFTGWGDDTLTVRRTLLRNNTPGNPAIGVHYDQLFMRHGEPTSVMVWIPIGDIRVEGGGLIYLEGSEVIGQKLESDFMRKAEASGMDEEES